MKKPTDQAPGTPKIKKPRKEKVIKATETPPPDLEQVPETTTQETPPSTEAITPEIPEAPITLGEPQTPEPESPPQEPFTAPITLESLQRQIDILNVQLQELLARKRKPPVSSGRVQIRDKSTGTIFKSKNNAYKTLLKSGDLKELVDKGVFGTVPEKNTFGWYALARAFPDRFEEVKPENPTPAHE
jgi:hypothetical protein